MIGRNILCQSINYSTCLTSPEIKSQTHCMQSLSSLASRKYNFFTVVISSQMIFKYEKEKGQRISTSFMQLSLLRRLVHYSEQMRILSFIISSKAGDKTWL